jgi:Ca-activated chloride channel family protein
VYEKGAKKSGESVQVNGGPPLNDSDLQALWLRRLQTKPADFLRAKFAFQSTRQPQGDSP